MAHRRHYKGFCTSDLRNTLGEKTALIACSHQIYTQNFPHEICGIWNQWPKACPLPMCETRLSRALYSEWALQTSILFLPGRVSLVQNFRPSSNLCMGVCVWMKPPGDESSVGSTLSLWDHDFEVKLRLCPVFVSQFIICTHSVSSWTSLGIFVSTNETAGVIKTANTVGFCPSQLDWWPLIHDIK